MGTSPILITVPHDGATRIPEAAVRKETLHRDENTLALAEKCTHSLSLMGLKPTLASFALHRDHVDVNRSINKEPFAVGFEAYYREFHQSLDDVIRGILAATPACLHLDIHAFVNSPGPEKYDIVIGSKRHKTCLRGSDLQIADRLSAMKSETLDRKYNVTFSPESARNVDGRYSGGWISSRTGKTFGVLGLDSLQLEFNATTCLDKHAIAETSRHLAKTIADIA